jgi:hypothetical protein
MGDKTEQVSLWSTFENLVNDAEKRFFDHDFKGALKLWQEYARITGAQNWLRIYEELNYLVQEYQAANLKEAGEIFEEWLRLRNKLKHNQLSSYAFHIFEKLYARQFLAGKQVVSFDLATGIFCFIDKRYDKAKENLNVVLNHQPDNLLGRIFLSKSCFALNEDDKGIAYLTQAMFLGGNEILQDDVGSMQLRNLFGKLKSMHGKGEVGVWLVPFEAWFRNWLVWIEDITFFQVMQQKERNERILQVKYYASEKYRHFIRCLFIAEYVRQFLPKEKGIIWEQEAYMEKLDNNLYERYRKKRKPVA